jgi:single-strand DNA-binding protein
MNDLNRVTLTGRIGNTPELKDVGNDVTVTSFQLAVNRYDKKATAETVDWFYVKTFSKLGSYLTKGQLVAIDGQLRANKYENKNGEKRVSYEVVAENIYILSKKEEK